MKYKVGDIVRQYTDDRKVSWRGMVKYVGPITMPPFTRGNPELDEGWYWIEWDNGSSNRVDEDRVEFDKEYLRNKQLDELGIHDSEV